MSGAGTARQGPGMRRAAEASGTKPKVGLAAATIRKHFGNLSHFLKHLRAMASKSRNGPSKVFVLESPRLRYSPAAIQTEAAGYRSDLRKSDLYGLSGSSAGKRRKPGSQVFHDSLYYLPILFTYLGPRRKEFAGLPSTTLPRRGRICHPPSQPMASAIEDHAIKATAAHARRIDPIGLPRLLSGDQGIRLRSSLPGPLLGQDDNDPGDRFYDTSFP